MIFLLLFGHGRQIHFPLLVHQTILMAHNAFVLSMASMAQGIVKFQMAFSRKVLCSSMQVVMVMMVSNDFSLNSYIASSLASTMAFLFK